MIEIVYKKYSNLIFAMLVIRILSTILQMRSLFGVIPHGGVNNSYASEITTKGLISQVKEKVDHTGNVKLILTKPYENLVVQDDTLSLTGITSPNAVIFINGVEVLVKPNGSFSHKLVLDEGENIVSVVSSIDEAYTEKNIFINYQTTYDTDSAQ